MTHEWTALPLAAALLLCALSGALADQPLVDFGKGFDPAKVTARDAAVALIEQDGHPALRVTTGHAQNWPGIDLPAKFGPWDLSKREAVAVDLRNLGANAVTICLRVDNPGADGIHSCLTGRVQLQPGASGTLTVKLDRAQPGADKIKLFGMRGSPFGMASGAVLDPAMITNFVVFVDRPTEDHVFVVSNLRGVGDYQTPPEAALSADKFFPFIDEFGQYMHRDWPGKTHSVADLAASREAEAKDLQAHPGPAERDQYGGFTAGPQLQATGFFRTEKYQGKWWLVDPEGRLFWSHGVDCVTDVEGGTRLDEREAWFASLPPADGEFKACYGQTGRAVNGYYAQKPSRTFDFTRANLMRKYGDDYKATFADLAHRRLRSWGLNTIANWSDAAIYSQRRTPYTCNVWFDSRKLEGSKGYWGKFRDVFAPEFAASFRKQMSAQAGKSAGDPWCVGYFVDNELSWGDAGSLALGTLACPADQPAKQVFVADLRAKYGTIEALNGVWNTTYASWDALLQSQTTPDPKQAAADLRAFDAKTADMYFKTIRDILKEIAPNNLYLGCRFAWVNDAVAPVAAKYCDVVSYNLYRTSVTDFKPAADVPVIIGEFHFGALDRGMFHTGLVPMPTQEARAKAYHDYVQGALRNPCFVGSGWFKYMNEPTTGRTLDEENYQIGLVDGCDTPYPETIAAVREIGYGLYQTRLEGK